MRAGGCTVQQSLTAEAASVVKQAVTLARRRGHAQVTPLHVANTMLSASTGLLRTACLQSHSHPLQCKALELCFNVALNRLPASTSTPAAILGTSPHSHHHHHHHHQYPTISNALIAAFKRAQAHQRRGSIENQQQPLLAVKIELEQLIISILDDPSVSRVMREAGFSSTQVKSNIEQAVISLEMCSQSTTPSNKSKEISGSNTNNVLALSHNQSAPAVTKVVANKPRVSSSFDYPIRINNEDVMCVIENLMSKRKRNLVIVGECVASVEGVVRGVMDKIEKGDDDVPEALRDVKFIPFPLSSFRHMNRVEAEQKIEEMKILVRTTCSSGITGGGVVLNLGDLEWAESRASSSEQVRGYYCSIEHIIMELGKLVCGIGENKNGNNNARFWLIGVATFQTYMRCKSGHPSLESLWGLHPLTVPAGSLRLSLITTDSDLQSQFNTGRRGESRASLLLFEGGEESKQQQQQLACCADCSAKFEAEARSLKSSTSCNTSDSPTSSSLPAWLQQYKNEKATLSDINDRQDSGVRDLCKKWNSICNSTHKQPYYSERTLNFSSVSPSSSTYSGFSYDYQKHPNFHKTPHRDWSVAEPRHSWRENHFLFPSRDQSNNNQSTFDDHQPSFRLYIPEHSNQDLIKSSNPNSTPNSASSSDILMEMDYVPHNEFKELNSDNLTSLCNALEKKVPWQKDIVLDIASTVLKCRSGKMRRKGKANDQSEVIDKEETWMFFQGVDVGAKEKIAKELARVVFGSYDKFISIALSSFSSTRADSTDHHQDACRLNKRSRDEQSCSYIEKFAEAVSDNPHRVFLIEDVEQADYCSQKGFKRAIETGSITSTSNGDHDHEVSLGDAIIILSCESFSSRSRACSPPDKQKSDICDEEYKVSSLSMSLDLNISIDDESSEDDRSIDDIGLLDSVDKQIIFKSIE